MLCHSISAENYDQLLSQLRGVDFAEVRLDLANLSISEIEAVFSIGKRLIATYRPGDAEEKRLHDLLTAINSGANYIDIEFDATDAYQTALCDAARANGCEIILSFHDYVATPHESSLRPMLREMFMRGADIAKIACLVNQPEDNARLLSLLNEEKQLVVIGMGDLGKITRVAGPLLGAPFTYVYTDGQESTAPGQLSATQMQQIYDLLGVGYE